MASRTKLMGALALVNVMRPRFWQRNNMQSILFFLLLGKQGEQFDAVS